ncbi:MAG: hypothetical protein FWD55_04815 [Propionibacteriaceae bacterium]|nr:hypothetical protein [Propionibacteriaceae bacterium]
MATEYKQSKGFLIAGWIFAVPAILSVLLGSYLIYWDSTRPLDPNVVNDPWGIVGGFICILFGGVLMLPAAILFIVHAVRRPRPTIW